MSDSPSTAAAPSPAGADSADASAVQLGWTLLSSATTTAVLGLTLAALLVAAAAVEQGAGLKELLGLHGFAAARTIHGLGLSDIVFGWLPLLVMLLLVLNLLGLALRYALLSRFEPAGEDDVAGPLVSRVDGVLEVAPEEAEQRLVKALSGVRVHTRGHDGARVVRRGVWDGGMILLVAGCLALALALFVDRTSGFDGRFTSIPGDARRPATTEVRADGAWLERPELPFRCSQADPMDPWRRRDCVVPVEGGTAQVQLQAGATTDAGGLVFAPTHETPLPLPTDGRLRLVVRRGADGPPQLLEGAPGQLYRLPSGEQLGAWLGPDGPLVIARDAAGGRPVLLTPALDRPVAPGPGGLLLAGVPSWQVEVRAQARPERMLVLTGFGLLALGFLIMGLLPDLRATLLPAGEGRTRVVIRSVNRRALPRRVLEQLVTGGGAS